MVVLWMVCLLFIDDGVGVGLGWIRSSRMTAEKLCHFELDYRLLTTNRGLADGVRSERQGSNTKFLFSHASKHLTLPYINHPRELVTRRVLATTRVYYSRSSQNDTWAHHAPPFQGANTAFVR